MEPLNLNYSYCPSCGNKIYNYEDRCSECGTFKVIFDNSDNEPAAAYCKRCGCKLLNGFYFCPSCGNACKKQNGGNDSYDYEADGFLKILHDSRAALLSIFFAINAIWCSLFGVFYSVILIVSSLSCLGVQIYFVVRKKYQKRIFSICFIIIAIFLLIVAVIMTIVMVNVRNEAIDSILNILF